jgi:hypothetical protein
MSGVFSVTSLRRALVVLACSVVLGLGLWLVAEQLGSPTPTAMRPGLDQPALVGLEHTVTYLAVGTAVWLGPAALIWFLERRPGATRGTGARD